MPAAAITLLVTISLLWGFIAFRLWEEKRGFKILARARESADVAVTKAYHSAVMGNIPSNWRVVLLAFMHQVSHALVVLAVETLRAIERPLSRLSYRMRRGVPLANGKEPSEFLKTITPAPTPDKGRGSDLSDDATESVGKK